MFDCTTDRYDALYGRWLGNPGRLLDLGHWEPGQRLLDLCGGTGVVSREAIRRGAEPLSIVLLDLNPRAGDTGVLQVRGSAEKVRPTLTKGQFDVIVCRQAMAYLDISNGLFASLRTLLRPGGRLVFNTFVRPRWAAKIYRYQGRRFLELSGYVGRRVFHVQAGWGVGVDLTAFRWHRDLDLRTHLHGFHVQEHRSERSVRWVCTKDAGF